MAKINLKIDPSNFNEIYIKNLNNFERYQIYFGGSSSGKSVFLAQRAVLDVFKGGRNYLVVRNTQNTIKRSCLNEITKAIKRFNLGEYFNINKSDLVITCNINGHQILFAGLDDPEKIKSITPQTGVITDIWVEEATECGYDAIKQLDKRLRGYSTVPKRLTMSFNPILKSHWIYNEFFTGWVEGTVEYIDKNSKLYILHTTYNDNKFLTQDDIDALENETDEYYYNVYTLGRWGVLGELVYKNWTVEEFDDSNFDNYRNGIDWGFGADPFALIRVHLDKRNRRIYVCDELYLYEVTNSDVGELVKNMIGRERVICDSAEPKSIEDFVRMGIRAVGAKKGAGSVEFGIKFIQSHDVIIHPRCVHTYEEFSKYTWKTDRNGVKLPIPVDKDNHLLDALRYALEDDFVETKRRIPMSGISRR